MTTSTVVVVPCKNEISNIERCLLSIRAQNPAPAWVVVVDNGSVDGSLDVARGLADEVLEIGTGTISALRNAGAEAALAAVDDAEVIAFVDADCEVHPGWLAAAQRSLSPRAEGGVEADLVGSRALAALRAPWVASRWAAIEARLAHGRSFVWSQHLAVRREVFEGVGGFAEALATGEDSDLSARVRAAGGAVRLVSEMRATHHGFPTTLRAFVRRERWHTGSPGWFARMSPRGQTLVGAGAAWTALGALAAAGSAKGGRRALFGWAALTAAAVPLLGRLAGGPHPGVGVKDGVLLTLWTAIRVLRLPSEAVRTVRRGASPHRPSSSSSSTAAAPTSSISSSPGCPPTCRSSSPTMPATATAWAVPMAASLSLIARDWRLKAAIQGLLSILPGGDRLNYILQRHVTRGLPRPTAPFNDHLEMAERHLRAYDRYAGGLPATAYEFGAGWDMIVAIAMARAGVRRHVVVDIRALARPELIADTARRLAIVLPTASTLTGQLAGLGIEYRAPCDARATGLPAHSIDLVHSTDTLEHIPQRDVMPILRECARILRPGGIASFRIDYKDHYSYFDPRRGRFAFLAASPRAWRLASPSLHFQNRLRHCDYIAAAKAAGFEIVEEERGAASPAELPKVHSMFARYTGDELAVPDGLLVLRR